jgi:hypothetical protein
MTDVLFVAGAWGAANLSLPSGGAAYRILGECVSIKIVVRFGVRLTL